MSDRRFSISVRQILILVIGLSTTAAFTTPVFGQEGPAPRDPSSTASDSLLPRRAPVKPVAAVIADGYSHRRLHVKFVEGSAIRLRSGDLMSVGFDDTDGLEQVLADYPGVRFERLFSRPETKLTAEKREVEARSSRQQADLNLYYRFFVPDDMPAESLIDDLNSLDIVEIAYAEPLPQPSPVSPDYGPNQVYLKPATDGIDAEYAWTQPGGRGGNVTIVDIETDWNYTHEDLSEIAEDGTLIRNGTPCDFGSGTDHGTAVVGQLVADRNGFGVTGGVYEADLFTVNRLNETFGSCVTDTSDSINIATDALVPGDVMLIETQVDGPGEIYCDGTGGSQAGLLPEEWVLASYDAIVHAVSRGIIVVEAAGNGGCNLDSPIFGSPFPGGRSDSGAIMVGAGAPPGGTPPAHERLDFSNYGARVNLHSWGQYVFTTGYGDLFGSPDPGPYAISNEDYTNTFGGTSSSSSIVTSAVVALSSIAQQQGLLLTPQEIRTLLMTSGTPQVFGLGGNIGPQPNTNSALYRSGPKAMADSYSVLIGGSVTSTSSFAPDVEPNDTLATSNSVDGRFSVGHNPDVGNKTGNVSTVFPHVTARGTGDGTVDLYRFTVSSVPTPAIFDIDDGFGSPGGFDSTMRILDSGGVPIATGNDSDFAWGAGGSIPFDSGGTSTTRDAYIEHEITVAGTYYVEVGAFDGIPNQPLPPGADYKLQIVVPGMATSAIPGVLENDVDIARPGDTLTAVLSLDTPDHGSVVMNPDGSFTYTHDGSANLTDSFQYYATDWITNNYNSVIITVVPPPPVNDDFANATAVVGTGFGTNTGATKEPFEPNHGGDSGGASAWWKWTALADGYLTVDTAGSNFDTTLGVYSGPSVGALTNLGSNDDLGALNRASRASSVPVTSGTTYYIAVDGHTTVQPATGLVQLNTSFSTLVEPTFGLVDIAAGQWHLRNSSGVETSFYYGNPGDLPISGDWDGNGTSTPGLFRQSDGLFYARNSNTVGIADAECFAGDPADIPIAGDWDGDGDDNLGIYRPSEQRFYLFTITCTGAPMGAAPMSFLFGDPGDKPVVGDWDGDGIDEVGLHRKSTGFFYWRNTLDSGIASGEIFFGDPNDRLLAGDWGLIDGIDTPAIFRPSDVTFYFRHSLTAGNADNQIVWAGAGTGWLPVAGAFGLS